MSYLKDLIELEKQERTTQSRERVAELVTGGHCRKMTDREARWEARNGWVRGRPLTDSIDPDVV